MIDRFDAVFFDNDGILVDTEPLFLRASQEVFATVGIELDAATYHDLTMTEGRTVFELATARGISDGEILALREVRARRYSELIREGVRVLEGVPETVETIAGRRPTAIVTSSSRDHFDEIHDQTGLVPHFEFVLADGDYARHKPHPDPYLAAAERMGVDPARCLAIEDTVRGLAAATSAGMHCVVIPNELTRGADFSRATVVLESMVELPEWLGVSGSR